MTSLQSQNPLPAPDPPADTQDDAAGEKLRDLSHELSNALEVIMQTSFLLGTLDLGENGRQWHSMLDAGVQKAIGINRQVREIVRSREKQ